MGYYVPGIKYNKHQCFHHTDLNIANIWLYLLFLLLGIKTLQKNRGILALGPKAIHSASHFPAVVVSWMSSVVSSPFFYHYRFMWSLLPGAICSIVWTSAMGVWLNFHITRGWQEAPIPSPSLAQASKSCSPYLPWIHQNSSNDDVYPHLNQSPPQESQDPQTSLNYHILTSIRLWPHPLFSLLHEPVPYS